MFVDASAIVGILANEEDSQLLLDKVSTSAKILSSPIAMLEATMGLARALDTTPERTTILVNRLLEKVGAEIVSITTEVGVTATEAHVRYGKGRHKAKLNIGDCFAYACAKVHRVPLLCKGDDFIHTDIELA
jgi:ribonuclease VapC